MATTVPVPQPLEPPPRSTGDAQNDYPLLLNWLQRAYQNILQAVQYINQQVTAPDFDPTNLPDPATATTASAQQTANDAYVLAGQAEDKAEAAQTDADTAQTTATTAQTTANTAATDATNALAAASTAQTDATTALSNASTALSTANSAQSLANTNAAVLARMVSGTTTVSDASTGATVTFGSAQPDTAYTVNVQAKSSTGGPSIDSFVVISKTYATGNFSFTIGAAPGVGNSVTFEWQLIRIT